MGVASFKGNDPIPELTDQDINNWVSREFEVDYIRIYESDPELWNEITNNVLDTSTIVIIIMAIFVVILVIFLVIAFAIMRNQGRKQYDQVQNDEFYDDSIEQYDFYEENRYLPINSTTEQVYDHIYDQPYSQVNNGNLQKISCEQEYLEMTQKKGIKQNNLDCLNLKNILT